MGDHCTTDRPTPADLPTPAGELTTLNTIEAYVSKPASYPSAPAKLLLLLTSGTGIHSVNNQLQADAFAQRGFLVVMPDQFGGDPAPKTTTTPADAAAAGVTLIERIKLGMGEAAKSFMIDMWLARHTPSSVLPRVQKAVEGAREAYADAVANGGGIYGAGYCFGAKYVLLLCGSRTEEEAGRKAEDVEDATALKEPELKCGAIAHGTMVTREDIETVRVPVAMACVKDDSLFPDDVREQGKASLELNKVEHDVKVFEGVPHGFAVVGEYTDEHIKDSQAEAFEMMSGWLESH